LANASIAAVPARCRFVQQSHNERVVLPTTLPEVLFFLGMDEKPQVCEIFQLRAVEPEPEDAKGIIRLVLKEQVDD
jgi:hypothetical protein